MGRRRNNPELVEELLDGLRDMPDDEFLEKYNSLSSSDKSIVGDAINHMGDDDDDDYIPEGCAACGNPAYPYCQSSCNLFDE